MHRRRYRNAAASRIVGATSVRLTGRSFRSAARLPRIFDDQGDMQQVLVRRVGVAHALAFAEGLSMIRGDDDHRIVVGTASLKPRNHLPDLRV